MSTPKQTPRYDPNAINPAYDPIIDHSPHGQRPFISTSTSPPTTDLYAHRVDVKIRPPPMSPPSSHRRRPGDPRIQGCQPTTTAPTPLLPVLSDPTRPTACRFSVCTPRTRSFPTKITSLAAPGPTYSGRNFSSHTPNHPHLTKTPNLNPPN